MSQAWPVTAFAEIDSTNEEARRRATSGQFADQWITAAQQSAGRGRMGRTWVSPAGNLYATALFHWNMPMETATRLAFAAGLAVADTVAELAPVSAPKLKWPNDVRIGGAKISGVLIETGEVVGRRWIALGLGLNVGFAPDVADQKTTCIADLRGDELISVSIAHEALRASFATRFDQAKAGFETLRTDWLARAEALGEPVRVTAGETVIEGTFETLAADGALIVRLPSGEQQTIRAGDVNLIREAS